MATAREITECRIGSLRSRAVREVRVICESFGLCWISSADDLRWNDSSKQAECRIYGIWLAVSELGIVDFAAAENLPYEQTLDVEELAEVAALKDMRHLQEVLHDKLYQFEQQLDTLRLRVLRGDKEASLDLRKIKRKVLALYNRIDAIEEEIEVHLRINPELEELD